MLRLFGTFFILLLFGSSFADTNCSCKKLPDEAKTKTGWMQLEIKEEKPVKTIRGNVIDLTENVLVGSYVEVFRNEEWNEDSDDELLEKRVAGCEIGKDGKFCFTGLPAGKYAVRVSQDDFDTLTIFVEVSSKGVSKKLKAMMKPSN